MSPATLTQIICGCDAVRSSSGNSISKKRVFELTAGERFRLGGTRFEVGKIENGRLYYKRINEFDEAEEITGSLGAKSSQIIEVIHNW